MLLMNNELWWVDPDWMPGTHQATLSFLSWTGDREYNETPMGQDKDRARSLMIGTTTTKTVS